jgi:hypothetical protein
VPLHLERIGDNIELLIKAITTMVQEGVCMPKASSLFVAILDYFRGIEWHVRQIAQRLSAPLAS